LWAAGGAYSSSVDASNNVNHPARASCLVVREAFSSGQDIHLGLQTMRDMLDGWVATSVITQAQKDSLLALATQPASRAEVLGFGRVTEQDLRTALEL
jgi:erythromycin esterase-like protein